MSGDSIQPFVFESLPVRGALVQVEAAWQEMQGEHGYDAAASVLLGQATAATLLVAQSLKLDGSVTLQLTMHGSLLVVQCTDRLDVRGMLTPQTLGNAAGFSELARGATCAVTVEAGEMERPYQGIVEITGDSLAASLEHYFDRSVQVPTHLVLLATAERCGGMLLQQMPGGSGVLPDDWQRLGLLAGTLSDIDLIGGAGADLLARIFSEDDIRAFERRSLRFRCRCSREKIEDVLRMLGEVETREALNESGHVEVTCEFCGRRRRFDAVDVTRVFAGHAPLSPGTLH